MAEDGPPFADDADDTVEELWAWLRPAEDDALVFVTIGLGEDAPTHRLDLRGVIYRRTHDGLVDAVYLSAWPDPIPDDN